jgi:hypothetical protein
MNEYLKKIFLESYINQGRRWYAGIQFSHIVWNYYNPDNKWEKGYAIHHIDEDKLNDNISNLQKMVRGEHQRYHHLGEKCNFYGDKNPCRNTFYITNGYENKRWKEKYRELPEGFYKGRLMDQSGEKNPMYNKHRSKESKQKQSIIMKEKFVGKKHPHYGTFWITNNIKEKLWKSELGKLPEGFYNGRLVKIKGMKI